MDEKLRLFEWWVVENDCVQEQYVCWKMLAGVALSMELVLKDNVNEGWEFRMIPLTV